MAGALYLASTLVMGVLIAGVVALMVRGRRWHHYTPQAAYGKLNAGGGGPASAIDRLVRAPSVWMAAFFALVVLVVGGVVAVLGGTGSGSGAGTSPIGLPVLVGFLGAVVVVYFVGGVYVAMRDTGHPTSRAVAGSALALGALFLLGLVVRLVLSG